MMTISTYCENIEIIERNILQTALISKLDNIFSEFPSKLKIGGEPLFGGITRAVLFNTLFKLYIFLSVAMKSTTSNAL